MWENKSSRWGFLYYSSAKISCTRYNQQNKRGFFVRNFIDTSRRVSDPGEDLLLRQPLRENCNPNVALPLRSPSSVSQPLRSPSSVSQPLRCPPSALHLLLLTSRLMLIPSLSPSHLQLSLSDSIFSCRTSTEEKIKLTRVTEYLPLVYFQMPFDVLLIIFQLRTNNPN